MSNKLMLGLIRLHLTLFKTRPILDNRRAKAATNSTACTNEISQREVNSSLIDSSDRLAAKPRQTSEAAPFDL
jgi:hypothetical protein